MMMTMTRRTRLTVMAVAGAALALGMFVAGGVAHAAFSFFDMFAGDQAWLECHVSPGQNRALGWQVMYENGEPVALYLECKAW